ncbi:hypothetical protein [Thalassotalea piscium]|uniref:Uncharacterized protein n=1 Tax=Thalassotalea piscium TaxID=1230533 RepID=A0A7X0TT11_9GAMM|nr:hypothetical protein [Thalassotalea piscium]MBB6542669.1 hypothetical protein [Thalassotalea piscium]
MINNINAYSNLLSANPSASSTSAEVEDIIASHKQKEATAPLNQETSTNLYLSTRAQKINSISQEFFSKGDLNFEDIDSLKIRAYQLGLISKQEYAHLTKTELSDQELSASKELPNKNLVNFIGDFLKRLDETNAGKLDTPEDDNNVVEESETLVLLKESLLKAQVILADVEKAKTNPDFKESLASTLAFLNETISANVFEKMPLDDKVGFSKVYQALEIVDKISPQRLNNDKLNRYIQIGLD